jgi:hypothetical protein
MDQVLIHAIAWPENDELFSRLQQSDVFTLPAAAAVPVAVPMPH